MLALPPPARGTTCEERHSVERESERKRGVCYGKAMLQSGDGKETGLAEPPSSSKKGPGADRTWSATGRRDLALELSAAPSRLRALPVSSAPDLEAGESRDERSQEISDTGPGLTATRVARHSPGVGRLPDPDHHASGGRPRASPAHARRGGRRAQRTPGAEGLPRARLARSRVERALGRLDRRPAGRRLRETRTPPRRPAGRSGEWLSPSAGGREDFHGHGAKRPSSRRGGSTTARSRA